MARPSVTPPALLATLSDRAPQIAAVAVAALLAGKLALVLGQALPGMHRRPAAPAAPVAAPPRGLDAQALLGAHLFGTPPVAEGPVQPTSMALVLTGTLAGPDPARGWAIVGENAQSAKLYAVGATLPAGVRLAEVYADHVLLDRNGVKELLSLPNTFQAHGLMPRPVAAEVPLADNVQRIIASDPALIGQVMRPQPVFANGQLRGFRLYPGTDRNRFARLGLMPGDMVTQVNNVPLADPQHGMEVLRSLGSSSQATLTVERSGGPTQITIDNAKLNAATGPEGPAQIPGQGLPMVAPAVQPLPPPPSPDSE